MKILNSASTIRPPLSQADPRIVVAPTRSGASEYFLTARSIPNERLGEFIRRVEEGVCKQGATILSQTIVASHCESIDSEVREWSDRPITWIIEDAPCMGEAFQAQVWAISGSPTTPVSLGGRARAVLFEDDSFRFLRVGGLLPTHPSAPPGEQTAEVFAQMEAIVEKCGMGFRDVVRTWYYNRDILSWYSEFNQARNEFFRDRKVFEGLVPASTGIGADNPFGCALTAGLLAVQPKSRTAQVNKVLSPLQNSAMDYGSSFSRAVELTTPSERRLFVSGTASIGPAGETLYFGDTRRQIEWTLEVVKEILRSRGIQWEQVVRAHAFLRNPEDVTELAEAMGGQSLNTDHLAISGQTVCRDDLLFEIELDAILQIG